MSTIKDRLNEIMEYKELTATRFAGLIDANPSAISHLLKGRNRPGLEMLEHIARAFPDISMDWLISGTGSITGKNADTPVIAEEPLFRLQPPAEPEAVPPAKTAALPERTTAVPASLPGKTPKRVILFYADGSFEEFRND
ncbi:MAG: helix-turn-helix domain-containing protein [Culturomica sp.]|jgi:transcriptional regulator with XRE-family HTH domain|nr:helix-turn-helix domain-containing protein [Culturomica sp.]